MSEQIDFGEDEVAGGEAEGGPVAVVDDGQDVQFSYGEDEAAELPAVSLETPCSMLTGAAGSGKSFEIMRRIREDESYAVLAASTGVAAINLNTITIHSMLGFFDTNSLRDAYLQGSAQRKLRKIHAEGFKNVVIDEVSMISADTLDIIVRIFDDVNANLAVGESPIGIVLVGDFMQLPAIPEDRSRKAGIPWAFDAQAWPRFADDITRLTKIWRQSDARFLAALNYARCGRGGDMVGVLDACGVKWEGGVDNEFDGTTIVSKNETVDRFNQLALDRVKGRLIGLPSRRWGKSRAEWKNIPERTILRENAYVTLLANKYDGAEMVYANGDCGHVKGINPVLRPGQMPTIAIELVRNGQIVDVGPLVRGVESKDRPDSMSGEVRLSREDDDGRYLPQPHYRGREKRYVEGQVERYPIRLAFASTVHRSQGLSLDRVQIDVRDWMFKSPAMVYTALSRGRTLEGLRLVGMKEKWAEQCKVDPRAARWL